MKKSISFRLFFTVLWRGICQVFRFLGKFFGYKDGSSYAKVLWRVSATCLTVLLALFTGCLLYAFTTEVVIPKWISPSLNPEWESQRISNHVVFQKDYWGRKTRVYNEATGKVVLKDADWIVTSEDHDSLAVFAKDGKRGYINRFTGEVAIPAIYTRAWVFSEGLAAVEKDGELLFIDHSGDIVIDKGFEVHCSMPAYAFHDGYCLVKNPVNGNIGLIDRKGEWKLQPEYLDIRNLDSVWVVETVDGQEAVFDKGLNAILPFSDAEYYATGEAIVATLSDHTVRKYDFRGKLIESFCISDVEQMTYETGQLHYAETCEDDSDGEYGGTEDPVNVLATAKCFRYQAEYGWYGLMSPDGRVVTPPSYEYIRAIGADLYLCGDGHGNNILLDGKGDRVQ